MEYNIRIGEGFDVHRLAEGLPLTLGGVQIEHSKGCVAHSDGDVVIHAICDALLGAIAEGDIGYHFPDTDPRYRGIDSTKLLGEVMGLIRERGYEVVNIDSTIRMQRPRLREMILPMRRAIALAMGIDHGRVSVKATTTEKLGFEGTEEGVSASAVVLLAHRQLPPAGGVLPAEL